MKNKKLLYFLIPGVILVWGMIIYRILIASGANDDISIPVAAPLKEAYNDYSIPKDTTSLLLNYRDPFGITKPVDTFKLVTPKLHVFSAKSILRIPAMDWGFVRYSGYIRNPGSKKLIALLHINGKEVQLSEGETSDKIKLLRNMKDSIKIAFDGKIKYLLLNTAG